MLIKIQNIEEECGQLEDECENLKRRINRLLKEEEDEKERGREAHEQDTNAFFEENQKKATDLKTKLFTFHENVEAEEG